jgi:hypothetical protein
MEHGVFKHRWWRCWMVDYRAYVVGDDGHFLSFIAFICMDDTGAIEWAKQLVDGHAIELWSGERFIARLEQRQLH